MGKPRDERQKDLLRPSLDAIIDLGHPLARLARAIDWDFLDGRFSSVCRAGPGQPDEVSNTQEMAEKARRLAVREGFANLGDTLVITAGVPFKTPGTTNLLRIARVEQQAEAVARS